jgi:hypothetical protein
LVGLFTPKPLGYRDHDGVSPTAERFDNTSNPQKTADTSNDAPTVLSQRIPKNPGISVIITF